MKNTALLLLFLLPFTKVFSQAKDEKAMQISGISAQNGTYYFRDNYGGSLEQFKKLVPESDLLDKDFDDFNQSFYRADPDYGHAFSVQLAFDWLKKSERWNLLHPQLKFGVSFGSVNFISGSLNQTKFYRIDTLVSNSSGKEYYVDSVYNENYNLNYQADFLVLDASLIIGSNPLSCWSFYGGLGVSAGMNFNAKAIVYYSNDQYYYSRANYQNSNNHPQWDPEYKEEILSKSDAGLTLMMALPIGVNFRLSKHKNTWQYFSLFLEARPSLAYFSVSGIDDNFYTASFNSFGLKYSILD